MYRTVVEQFSGSHSDNCKLNCRRVNCKQFKDKVKGRNLADEESASESPFDSFTQSRRGALLRVLFDRGNRKTS
jgi:hypothetical protein